MNKNNEDKMIKHFIGRKHIKYYEKIINLLNMMKNSKKIINLDLFSKKMINKIKSSTVDEINKINKINKIKYDKNIEIIKNKRSEKYPLIYKYYNLLFNNSVTKKYICKLLKINYEDKFMSFDNFVNWNRLYNNWNNTIDIDYIDQLVSKSKSDKSNEINDELHLIHNEIKSNEIYKNIFISLDIQKNIESINIKKSYYKIYDNELIHNIILYDDNDNPNIWDDENNILKMLLYAIKTVGNIVNKKENVTIEIYLMKQKKIINHNENIIASDNINSGSSYLNRNKILIWRTEEFYKVLIHELIHLYGIDKFLIYQNTNIFPKINGTDHINESYTESLAILICSIMSHTIHNSNINIYTYVDKWITDEILFLIFQVSKILKIFKASTFDDYINNKITITQTTSFRSYFIIKLAILLNINDFAEKYHNNNYDINANENTFITICESWNNLIKNDYIIKSINNIIKYFEKYDSISFNKKWINQTCRMAVRSFVDKIDKIDNLDNLDNLF